jgi:uncharacterized caspase-like protein
MQLIRVLAVACGLAFALLAPVGGFAADGGGRVALVIGNSAYASVPKLATPRRDAEAIAKLLRDSGFDSVDLQVDVDYPGFRKAIRRFDDTSVGADIAVIFYAGHALEIRGMNYLVPVEARLVSEKDAPDEAIPLDRLMSVSHGKKRLVFLDACRDNPYIAKMRRAPAEEIRPTVGGFAKLEPDEPDTLIAYAAKAGSTSEEGDGEHSPFTAALLGNIAVPGLDIRLAMGRVRDQVRKSTAGRQEPFVYGSLGGYTLALVQGPERDPPSGNSNEARADFELVEKIGTRRALEVFLKTYPSGLYADLARAKLEKLGPAPPTVPPAPAKPDLGR